MLKAFLPLFPFFRKYRWNYLLGITSLAVTAGGQIIIPMMYRDAVDIIAAGSFSVIELLRPILISFAVAIAIALGRFGWRYWLHGAARRIETEFRFQLFTKFTRLSEAFYGKNKVGDLLARATNDMHAIRMACGMGFVALFDGTFMALAILIILFQQNSSLAALVILPLPIVTILVLSLGRIIGRLFRRVQEGFSRLSELSQEVFSNGKIIKSFVLEKYFLKKFAEANQDYQDRNLRQVQISGLLFPTVGFLSGISTVILLYFGGKEVILGGLSPGEFVSSLIYLQLMIWPMLGAGFTVNILQRGAASLHRVSEVLDHPDEFPEPRPGLTASPPRRKIAVQNLHTEYEGREVLRGLDFEIPAGSLFGIIGPTGSGKTSLVRAILRLIEPGKGTVMFDNRDIRDFDPDSYRQLFAYVPQDGFLFSDSVRNNIAFGLEDPDSETASARVARMVELSALTPDLELFPEGDQTQIGERGISVSGGQKQRIALARALAKDAEVLIIDDGLSALDSATEEKVLRGIMELRKGKTSIMISNRVSALEQADKILVLQEGRISALGTHKELLTVPGFYRDIAYLQSAEEGDAIA